MTFSSRSSRWVVLILACLLTVGAWPSPVQATSLAPVGARVALSTVALPAAVFAGIGDSIIGNRQRMIQFAFAGFGIGVLILVTATRKH